MEIKLTKGKVAIVDEIDADLARHNWRCNSKGYAVRWRDRGKLELLHRIILARILERELRSGEYVDHINGDKTDNRRENLRLATNTQNNANVGKRKGTYSSEYKGVSWYKPTKKWRARIVVNYKTIHLGLFPDEMDAASAYDEAAMEYFGDFANLNFPIEEEVCV